MQIIEKNTSSPGAACRACGGETREYLDILIESPVRRTLPLDACPLCRSLSYRGDDCVLGYDYALEHPGFWQHYAQCGAGITAMLQPLFSIGARGSLLDVGCGLGFVTDFWNRSGYGEAIGLEKAAYGPIGREKLAVPIFESYLADCKEIAGRTFDYVFSSEVIEHTKNPLGFIRELSTALSPSGVLVLTTPSADAVTTPSNESSRIGALSPLFHYLIFSESALRELLGKAGFRNITVQNAGGRLFAWASNVRNVDVQPSHIEWDDYFAYLQHLKANTCPHVRGGAYYRLFKDQWNTGRKQEAQVTFCEFEEFAKEKLDINLRHPNVSGYLQRRDCISDLDSQPAWMGGTLLFGSLLIGHMERDVVTQRRMLEAACAILRHEAVTAELRQFAQEAAVFWPFAEDALDSIADGQAVNEPHCTAEEWEGGLPPAPTAEGRSLAPRRRCSVRHLVRHAHWWFRNFTFARLRSAFGSGVRRWSRRLQS